MQLAQWDLASGTDFHAEAHGEKYVPRRPIGRRGKPPYSIPNDRFSYRTWQHIFDVPGKLA